MKIFEYQVKEIFRENGIATPDGCVVSTPDEAAQYVAKVGKDVVVKSQVHVGGRGKAVGIKFASNPEEARATTEELIGFDIKGEKVKTVLIEQKAPIKQEFYLGVTLNRKKKKSTIIFSPSGGMDIEQVAKESPENIAMIDIDPVLGLQNFHFNAIAQQVGFDKSLVSQLKVIVRNLYDIYVNGDCLTVEINPLALLESGEFVALDGKLEMDDNARYRQENLMKYWDQDDEDPIELIGKNAGFVVIKLSGRVSIISNGAGTAIATLDLLKKYDTDVANMLDLSGGAKSEKVVRAVSVVKQDRDVNAIVFNIFGGITRCDEIANGVAGALDSIPRNIPIICRLNGTNREEGVRILKEAGIEAEFDLEKAVQKTVKLLEDE